MHAGRKHCRRTEAALSPWVSKMTSPFLNLRHLHNVAWLMESMTECKRLQSGRSLVGVPSCKKRSCTAGYLWLALSAASGCTDCLLHPAVLGQWQAMEAPDRCGGGTCPASGPA